MEKKKVIYIVSSGVFLVLALGVIGWIMKDGVGGKSSQAVSQTEERGRDDASRQSDAVAPNKTVGARGAIQDMAAVETEERAYTIETKKDATQALEDMDGLVQSAGDTSL